MQNIGADEAAGLVRPTDTLAMPLGPTQPPRFLEALGKRTDWEDLRVFGALLTVFTDLFNHPNVHYLSGFFGPLERFLRDAGANIGFAPADFRRFGPLLSVVAPRVVTTAASPPDADGFCSLSLHAGAHVPTFHAAGADPDRLLVVEVSDAFPRTFGLGDHHHRLHVDEIDVLIESDASPYVLVDPPAQGRGLAKSLLAAGLAHLRDRGVPVVDLYVEADNLPALTLYAASGFVEAARDVLYVSRTPEAAGHVRS